MLVSSYGGGGKKQTTNRHVTLNDHSDQGSWLHRDPVDFVEAHLAKSAGSLYAAS